MRKAWVIVIEVWIAGAAQFGIAFTFSVCGSAIERSVGVEITKLLTITVVWI